MNSYTSKAASLYQDAPWAQINNWYGTLFDVFQTPCINFCVKIVSITLKLDKFWQVI